MKRAIPGNQVNQGGARMRPPGSVPLHLRPTVPELPEYLKEHVEEELEAAGLGQRANALLLSYLVDERSVAEAGRHPLLEAASGALRLSAVHIGRAVGFTADETLDALRLAFPTQKP